MRFTFRIAIRYKFLVYCDISIYCDTPSRRPDQGLNGGTLDPQAKSSTTTSLLPRDMSSPFWKKNQHSHWNKNCYIEKKNAHLTRRLWKIRQNQKNGRLFQSDTREQQTVQTLTAEHKFWIKEKKKEIWLSPMTKPPIPTENLKIKGQHTNATKNFDYTTIADRLKTVSWSNDSHPTGVVKPVYRIPTVPLTTKAV